MVKTISIPTLKGLKRTDIAPHYVDLIRSNPTDIEILTFNQLILSKWTSYGLIYIKEKAWKIVNQK